MSPCENGIGHGAAADHPPAPVARAVMERCTTATPAGQPPAIAAPAWPSPRKTSLVTQRDAGIVSRATAALTLASLISTAEFHP